MTLSVSSGRSEIYATQPGPARLAFLIWVSVLSVLYIFVLVNTPISILPIMAHDDGYYMGFGRLIAEGRWLGPYNQFTLMKGPGYPLFLALANWMGLSVTLARCLFHCVAVIVIVVIFRRIMSSYLAAAGLFALLLWDPVNYTGDLLRVLRDGFYADQVLIVLGLVTYAFFGASTRKELVFYSTLGGGVSGWMWITREESLWAVPGFALLAFIAFVIGVRQHRWREIVLSLGVILAAWGAVEASYRTINLIAYKRFTGVETSERHYKRALSALHSVRSGGTRPFVSVTREARRHIYAVSPTFALLEPIIEGEGGKNWAGHSCSAMPVSCGDIGSGWFAFLLRDAVAAKGGFLSPMRASTFFKQMADEINAACARGALECERHLVAELPNVSWSQLTQIPAKVWRAIQFILFHEMDRPTAPSVGQEEFFAVTLQFLHYPLHTRSADIPAHFVMRGWYHKPGDGRFSISIKNPANGEYAQIEWLASSDVVTHFGDPPETRQSFTAHIFCLRDCTLQLSGREGPVLERPVSTFLNTRGSMSVGGENLYLDVFQSTAQMTPSLAQRIAAKIRLTARDLHIVTGLVVFVVGGVAFLANGALAWASATRNICFILAFIAWVLATSRIVLIALIDATMMPILGFQYLAPANLLAWSAAVLSCVAAAHCLWPKQRWSHYVDSMRDRFRR